MSVGHPLKGLIGGNDRGALRSCLTLDHISQLLHLPKNTLTTLTIALSEANHVRNLQNASCRRTQTVAERSPFRELSDLTKLPPPLVPFHPFSRRLWKLTDFLRVFW